MPTSKRWIDVWLRYRSWYFLILALILLVVGTVATVQNLRFLSSAKKGTGTITALNYSHTTCHSRRKVPYDCTKFIAITRFDMDDVPVELELDAGQTEGHVGSLNKARWQVGENVPMVYDYKSQDFRIDSFWDLWKAVVLALGGSALLGGIAIRYLLSQRQ